jgi:23S rRNA (cytosine1962-C5)-methyltransferase
MLEKRVVSRHGGQVDSQELCLPVTSGGVLPCVASGRWFHG